MGQHEKVKRTDRTQPNGSRSVPKNHVHACWYCGIHRRYPRDAQSRFKCTLCGRLLTNMGGAWRPSKNGKWAANGKFPARKHANSEENPISVVKKARKIIIKKRESRTHLINLCRRFKLQHRGWRYVWRYLRS